MFKLNDTITDSLEAAYAFMRRNSITQLNDVKYTPEVEAEEVEIEEAE